MFAALLALLNSPLLQQIIAKAFPDPVEREKQFQALLGQLQAADAAQVEVNKAEAQSSRIFVSGWRPAVGWLGVIGLGYTFILAPLLAWILTFTHNPLPLPQVNSADLMYLVTALLGIGTMRSFEKIRGVAK